MQQWFRRGASARRGVGVGAILLSAAVLGACGGSASETPPPVEPVPERVLPDRETTAPPSTTPAASGGSSGSTDAAPSTGTPPAF